MWMSPPERLLDSMSYIMDDESKIEAAEHATQEDAGGDGDEPVRAGQGGWGVPGVRANT